MYLKIDINIHIICTNQFRINKLYFYFLLVSIEAVGFYTFLFISAVAHLRSLL